VRDLREGYGDYSALNLLVARRATETGDATNHFPRYSPISTQDHTLSIKQIFFCQFLSGDGWIVGDARQNWVHRHRICNSRM